VQRPKHLGGLDVLDLAKFKRALRLRWQWYRWKNSSKPWTKLPVTQGKTEDELFQACTTILVGNRECIRFWHARWLHGKSPKEIALALYNLAFHIMPVLPEGG
jgi:hypothetical protein